MSKNDYELSIIDFWLTDYKFYNNSSECKKMQIVIGFLP